MRCAPNAGCRKKSCCHRNFTFAGNATKAKQQQSTVEPIGRYASSMAAISQQARDALNVNTQRAEIAGRDRSCRHQTLGTPWATICAKNAATRLAPTRTARHLGNAEAKTPSFDARSGIAKTAVWTSAITRSPERICHNMQKKRVKMPLLEPTACQTLNKNHGKSSV